MASRPTASLRITSARRPFIFFWVLSLCVGSWASPSWADAPSFTADQATKGKALYQKHCALCHGARLEGEQVSPALTGARFDQMWRGKSASVLSFHLRRMPPEPVDAPGGLGDEVYTNILAFILQTNGLAPGEAALPSDLASLEDMTIPAVEGAALRAGRAGGRGRSIGAVEQAARGDRRDAAQPVTRRLAAPQPHLRQPDLQSARSDQEGQRPVPHARLARAAARRQPACRCRSCTGA